MENVERVATLVARMGAPFFLVSLIMLLLWAFRIQKRVASFIIACITALVVVTTLVTGKQVFVKNKGRTLILALTAAAAID